MAFLTLGVKYGKDNLKFVSNILFVKLRSRSTPGPVQFKSQKIAKDIKRYQRPGFIFFH